MFEIGNFSLLALSWQHYAFSIPLSLLSVFLMLVILVQRGRGGGLTGALGGMGGQSAFGTKAGDLFTRVTIAVAAIWILLSMLTLKVLNNPTAAVAAPPPAAADTDKTKSGTDKSKADGKATTDTSGELDFKAAPPASDSKAPAASVPATSVPATSEPAPPAPPTSAPPATSPTNPPATAPPPDDAKDANP
jgi:preprotein translocase subunit SecG